MSSLERRKEARLVVPLEKDCDRCIFQNKTDNQLYKASWSGEESEPEIGEHDECDMSDSDQSLKHRKPEIGKHDQSEDVNKVKPLPVDQNQSSLMIVDHDDNHNCDHNPNFFFILTCSYKGRPSIKNNPDHWPENPDESILRNLMDEVKGTGPAHVALPVFNIQIILNTLSLGKYQMNI